MFKKETVSSFTKINLSQSGMRGTTEHEILNIDGRASVCLYTIVYDNKERKRRLTESAECEAERIIKLLNDCNVMRWNGFSGKHPRGVLDGIMFRFTAEVNDAQLIRADGSQNFPKHYRDFTDGLYDILNGKGES